MSELRISRQGYGSVRKLTLRRLLSGPLHQGRFYGFPEPARIDPVLA